MGCFSDLQVFRFGEFPDLIASNFDFERKLFLDQNGLDTYAHTLHTIHCIRHTHMYIPLHCITVQNNTLQRNHFRLQVMISASGTHLAAVSRRGIAATSGANEHGQCKLPIGCARSARAVACGRLHTVWLCNDGDVVACGENRYGQCNIPMWPPADYTQVSAAACHTGLLHSDGIRETDNTTAAERCISPVVCLSVPYTPMGGCPIALRWRWCCHLPQAQSCLWALIAMANATSH